ncbi:MAG: DUF512 domain-containing protein [Armatimonadetes bacterium]|nr:DUF512 domain-containing protein [Armatimonadota bacterium]
MGGVISYIKPRSIARDLCWEIGDEIVSINGHPLQDIIDYRFYCSEEFLKVRIRRGDESAGFEIEKDLDMTLGVEFEDILFDGVRTCGANCIFCFVEQLPKGLRQPLYLKDDDYRLSFLHGNFITLANVTEDDLERIVTMRLSPLYISVHTTEQDLREKMLGRKAPDILAQIDTLAKARISLHTQIVLCPGINDGKHLDRSIRDLADRYPTVQSIAIVPAGLSAHRGDKTQIDSIERYYSGCIIKKVKVWQLLCMHEKGTRLVWPADEFYLNAGKPVLSVAAYERYPQIENGVGLVGQFKESANRVTRILPTKLSRSVKITVVTGLLSASLLREWAASLNCENLTVRVQPITNHLFGEMVTVTGLIAGRDIIDQLRGQDLGDAVIVPSVAVRDGAFLDDVTPQEVERELGCRVIVTEPRPYKLVRTIIRELT